MPACHGWSVVQPESCNTALQNVKEINPVGQTVLGPGIPPLLQTGQGGVLGCCSALPRWGWVLDPDAARLWPCHRSCGLSWPWSGGAGPQRSSAGQHSAAPKSPLRRHPIPQAVLRPRGTHRYILHWGHIASVQLGLMRVQPRHQSRERQ